MGRDSTWVNDDGLTVGYGTRSTDNEVLSNIATEGTFKVATAKYTLADLEEEGSLTAASWPVTGITIPRGSYITKATLQATVAAAGGVLNVGTFAFGDPTIADGVVDDVDGIYDGVTAALLAVGGVVEGDRATYGGALVNGTIGVGGTSNSNVTIVPAFTTVFTAGEVVLTVEYVVPNTATGIIEL